MRFSGKAYEKCRVYYNEDCSGRRREGCSCSGLENAAGRRRQRSRRVPGECVRFQRCPRFSSVCDLGRLFLVQSGYNDLGACAMREDLRRDAKPGRRVFQDSRVAWFGDLGKQLAEPSWSVNHRDDAPTLAALRQVTGAVPRCHAGALPPTQSRPAIGFRYDPSLDRKRCCVPTLSAGAPAAKCEPTGRTGSHLWLTI
jgi:hypothetical protein